MPLEVPVPNKTILLAAAFIVSAATMALAQSTPPTPPKSTDPSGSVSQPQGETGPIVTKSGGAPASSPQGDTPAGMQAAPKGSSKTIQTDAKGAVEGTPKD